MMGCFLMNLFDEYKPIITMRQAPIKTIIEPYMDLVSAVINSMNIVMP